MSNNELPNGWINSTLGEIAYWGSGGTPSRKNTEYYGGDIPWVKTGDLGCKVLTNVDEFITQEAVNNDDLTGVSFVIPSERVLHLFHERTQSIYSQISKNICENQELTQLRDWLLPMLMKGQAVVQD